MAISLEQILANAQGAWERKTLNGRPHLVVPAVTIVPGVLNGSKGSLFYPPEEIIKSVHAWNGMPVTVGHPQEDGAFVSARQPGIEDKFGIGRVYDAMYDGQLRNMVWLDEELTRQKAPQILNAVLAGQPVELSTGLKTDDDETPGTYNGKNGQKTYTHVARNYQPDHLAILIGQKGACSIRDGCGLGVNHAGECSVVNEAIEEANGSLLLRMWDRVVNAFLPNQPRSQVTGKIKRQNAGQGKGEAHEAAQQGLYGSLEGHVKPGGDDEDVEDDLVENGNDFFSECPRDEGGHCTSGEGGAAKGSATPKASREIRIEATRASFKITKIVTGTPGTVHASTKHKVLSRSGKTVGTIIEQLDPQHVLKGGGYEKRILVSDNKGTNLGSVKSVAEGKKLLATRLVDKKIAKEQLNTNNGIVLNYIREEDGKFCVYSEDGKKLGEHETRAEAEAQLRAIEASKHKANTDGGSSNESVTTTNREDDMSKRKEHVALLVNCACGTWKGKEAVLNDAKVFSDEEIAKLADHLKMNEANALVVNAVKEKLGDKAPALNEMPAFIKAKIEAKEKKDEDDEDEDDEEKTANRKGKKVQQAMNITAEQFDQLLKANLGYDSATIKAGMGVAINHEKETREMLVAQLVANAGTPEQKRIAAGIYGKLSLPELRSLVTTIPAVRNNGDAGERFATFLGGAGAGTPTYNADELEVLDEPTFNVAGAKGAAKVAERREREPELV